MTPGPLPWHGREIESILPHRPPFLFVDRVVEIEVDRRVVGTRVWAAGEATITLPDRTRAVPAAYLAECMAQVGAVLILSKPENRGKLIYFLSIDSARFRRPVRAGDLLSVEAEVVRLRSRMGTLRGRARVGDRLIADGSMTFALGGEAAS
jgi:3-hydroxyacyl-[acyl-carrier-protein] dehydratase